MSWSIVEVARMSGVTSRTLRHYDDIGLLPAAGVQSNGYRYYHESDLLRLQQIRVLRELDLGLTEIKAILDEQSDPAEALRGHHQRLLTERDRLTRVAHTVARTIEELENHAGDSNMSRINRPENLFEGFDPTEYDEEARQRWPEQWQESKQRTAAMTPADVERLQQEQTAAMIRMAELMGAGTDIGDPAVQAEIDAAYRTICTMWTPDATAFKCLGDMYVDDPRFTATYDKIATGLAEYYRDAMAVYADAMLE
ncbi:DNA-binding transcriptional MerR regulator [Williamsia limnetica]|uniref:DNA-binding transcriptional MerR regulator n=1 Tax=Williamsia limnetica TaxID=882452 RepID=A0A318RT77_WILLI|nr:MerR family transcriptional regulator [Williamsia limnetica]PYE15600.1 DNA-binding transcriptional MerR regulator [Williamsia limnetica]